MSSDHLVYDFAGIDTVSASINAFVGQMNEQLAEVERAFNALLANGWTGAGANAFQGCKAQWHSNAHQMSLTLQQLGQKVGEAAVNMQAADNAAGARFHH